MTTTIGIAMVKDEADVIAGTIRHMAQEVSQLYVADNGSTDGTREILEELALEVPLTIVDDPEPGFYQSAKMTILAARAAAEAGGDDIWIVPFDADELWTSPDGRPLYEALAMDLDIHVVQADVYTHLSTALDAQDPDPFSRMVWRRPDPDRLYKVAFRYQVGAVLHQGNNGVTLPQRGETAWHRLQVDHFPVRDPHQFVRKVTNGHAAYEAAPDLPVTVGVQWRAWGQLLEQAGEGALHQVYRDHWWHLSPVDAGLVHEPAPYLQEYVTEPSPVQEPGPEPAPDEVMEALDLADAQLEAQVA